MSRKLYSDEQERYVVEHYADRKAQDIAEELGLKVGCVYRIAQARNLKKSEEFLNSTQSGRLKKLTSSGIAYRFPKGHTSWNKGKKMQSVGRMAETQFKKGNVPHNVKFDGYERITKDGYIEVRVKMGKFKLKHRVVWESVNGPVPRDSCVVFKDGNKLNCDIENLELITRAENMKRNTIHRYSEEMKPIVKLIGKLKNKIHEKSSRRPKKPPLCTA